MTTTHAHWVRRCPDLDGDTRNEEHVSPVNGLNPCRNVSHLRTETINKVCAVLLGLSLLGALYCAGVFDRIIHRLFF